MKSKCIIIVAFFMLFFASNLLIASDGKKDIPLQGQWQEDKRSLLPEYPVSAVLDGTNLFIQSSSLRSNMVIRFLDGSNVIKEEFVPVGTATAIISILDLVAGQTYQIVITNQWNGHLQGEFMKE